MNLYDQMTTGVERGMTVLATAWIPHNPVTLGLAAAVCWYGRRVALTYAPGYIAQYFINFTVTSMGATTGKIIGATVIAPLFTPSLVPITAAVFGCALFYSISVICNLIQMLWNSYKNRKSQGGVNVPV